MLIWIQYLLVTTSQISGTFNHGFVLSFSTQQHIPHWSKSIPFSAIYLLWNSLSVEHGSLFYASLYTLQASKLNNESTQAIDKLSTVETLMHICDKNLHYIHYQMKLILKFDKQAFKAINRINLFTTQHILFSIYNRLPFVLAILVFVSRLVIFFKVVRKWKQLFVCEVTMHYTMAWGWIAAMCLWYWTIQKVVGSCGESWDLTT